MTQEQKRRLKKHGKNTWKKDEGNALDANRPRDQRQTENRYATTCKYFKSM